ncbi:cyclin-dependent kinase inhibitor 1Ba [Etheostoma spectabile]|uniref:cyclin-dependent kinase inhibitor 1Ba n=1 Tax=Etheostoma spectabile TaxID=54343 RepID=UPI0013AFC2C0|nr:cyclin-dependent kinase inhibitor 1B-like [Etheostoma spectabile]
MIRAEYARIIPVTLHFKGILLGSRSLTGFGCCLFCFFPPCHMCNKMSDVRLSNASPTLERVDARQPDNVRPSVRRNLFGRPDPEEIQRNVTASIRENVRSFTETYNFDPVNDRPLAPRNYVWEEDHNAPEFYVRQPHRSQRPQRDEDFRGDNNRQDAETRSELQSDQPQRDGSRKRRSGTSGPCSSECEKKRSHTDEDDDEDKSDGAGSQAVKAEEERPSRSEESADVQ